MNILYAMSTKSDFERKTFCVKIAVDLFVRSWVETFISWYLHKKRRVDLFVRSWVETSTLLFLCRKVSSTSSWGRELKRHCNLWNILFECRPLREVVSWNVFVAFPLTTILSRPLREVVSWNILWNFLVTNAEVDLFVRSWVETCLQVGDESRFTVDLFVRSWVETLTKEQREFLDKSTSSWGRELKHVEELLKGVNQWSTSSWGRELKH